MSDDQFLITELTPEQEAMLPMFRDIGLKMALSTERSDRRAGTAAIKAHYHNCGLNEPEVIWFDSPFGLVSDYVNNQVWNQVNNPVRKEVWNQVSDHVKKQVWNQVNNSVRNHIKDRVRNQVNNQVWNQVRKQVWNQVSDQVWNQVSDQVWNHIKDRVRNQVHNQVWNQTLSYAGGYRDSNFCVDIMLWAEYGLSFPASVFSLIDVCQHAWWYYPGEDKVLVSDRPTQIRRDQDHNLHCENGKAIEFMDGNGFSAWHGQVIPDDWVTGKPPSPVEALTWNSMDQRAAACEIVGWHNILDTLDARVIDADHDPMIGNLVEVDLPDNGPQRFIDTVCGTGRRFALLAPMEAQTALQAQALINDVPENFIRDLKVRT